MIYDLMLYDLGLILL